MILGVTTFLGLGQPLLSPRLIEQDLGCYGEA